MAVNEMSVTGLLALIVFLCETSCETKNLRRITLSLRTFFFGPIGESLIRDLYTCSSRRRMSGSGLQETSDELCDRIAIRSGDFLIRCCFLHET